MSTTYEEERTELEKQIDGDILERVKRGLALLEETHGPGWEDKIDMELLDLNSPMFCVLGQVFAEEARARRCACGCGDPWTGYDLFCDRHFRGRGHDVCDYGFNTENEDYDALQQAWEHVLAPRVSKGECHGG